MNDELSILQDCITGLRNLEFLNLQGMTINSTFISIKYVNKEEIKSFVKDVLGKADSIEERERERDDSLTIRNSNHGGSDIMSKEEINLQNRIKVL